MNIKEARATLGLTQDSLAEALGMSSRGIQQAERRGDAQGPMVLALTHLLENREESPASYLERGAINDPSIRHDRKLLVLTSIAASLKRIADEMGIPH